MKIAFDAKRITHNKTGLGNYSRFIINALSKYYTDNILMLFTPDKGIHRLSEQIVKSDQVKFFYSTYKSKIMKSIWRSFLLPNDVVKNKAVIFHGLSNEIPFFIKRKGIRSIVSIHDLIFIRYPEYYKWIDRQIYYYKFKYACLQSTRIIAISEMTKKDIISFYNINPAKIDVVYQGCDKSFTHKVTEQKKNAIRAKYDLPDEYILSVGTIEERKNLMVLVKALENVSSEIKLIVVGKETNYTQSIYSYIEEHDLKDRILFFHTVSFDELPSLYQMATLFVYPSRFEGFGIPIVEALYSEIPVIAAKGSCLEEAGGKYSLYVDPDDACDLTGKINKVLSNKELASVMVEEGLKHAAMFSEENIAKRIMSIYKKTILEQTI